MFIGVIVACTLGLADPTPADCKSFTSPTFLETEEDCVFELSYRGAQAMLAIGLEPKDAKCIPTSIFKPKV